jgi:hypothetical protein
MPFQDEPVTFAAHDCISVKELIFEQSIGRQEREEAIGKRACMSSAWASFIHLEEMDPVHQHGASQRNLL